MISTDYTNAVSIIWNQSFAFVVMASASYKFIYIFFLFYMLMCVAKAADED
jgi:hypothetical protein